ncbi:sigma 54-interacting transcriptional regulator [Clostridium sp. PL3]|uniref:Sigma 54-interacting transcriptional regulator n=1 Tax=Clostridium thailandense TaxID=2794346 RepID=A0A949TWJ3_9CLOT|nr:sigma 54-interacting transcriptional regulator [Clostridium thailandense]MBV7272770.1 sigma 54-interacting transcriptional regulator [Clostridium thailandense]
MYFDFTLEEINTRNGILDKLLDTAFDAAVIIDENGHFIHCSRGSLELTNLKREEVIGQHYSCIDAKSPFESVLNTGKHQTGVMVVINGRKCMTNLFPIISDGKVIGVIGVVLFRNLNNLKNILANMTKSTESQFKDIYDVLARVDSNYTFNDYIGKSSVVKNMLEECRMASKTLYPVLIIGETGTGKEILASGFHSENMKAVTPFVKINCTAIPDDLLESELFGYEKGAFTGAVAAKKGKFELAAGGTVLLDEIGDMNLRLQSKLLRVLEEKEYERIGGNKLLPLNARIIASTNRNLKELCGQGKFRQDLYYRLNTIEIKVPPLRARKEDIPILVKHFIDKGQLNISFSDESLETLYQYNWPGNVRELRNVVNRLSVNYNNKQVSPDNILRIIEPDLNLYHHNSDSTFPQNKLNQMAIGSSFEAHEKQLIINTLENCSYNISSAAKELKICRSTLYNKIKRYGITLDKAVKVREN